MGSGVTGGRKAGGTAAARQNPDGRRATGALPSREKGRGLLEGHQRTGAESPSPQGKGGLENLFQSGKSALDRRTAGLGKGEADLCGGGIPASKRFDAKRARKEKPNAGTATSWLVAVFLSNFL